MSLNFFAPWRLGHSYISKESERSHLRLLKVSHEDLVTNRWLLHSLRSQGSAFRYERKKFYLGNVSSHMWAVKMKGTAAISNMRSLKFKSIWPVSRLMQSDKGCNFTSKKTSDFIFGVIVIENPTVYRQWISEDKTARSQPTNFIEVKTKIHLSCRKIMIWETHWLNRKILSQNL